MKKIQILILLSSLNLVAADKPKIDVEKRPEIKTESSKPLKIKVIEGKTILSNSKEGKEIEEKLMKVRKNLEGDIVKLQQSIEADIKSLQSKAQIMTPETLEIEQEKIMRKKKEHELKVNQAQEDLNRHLQRELGKFNKKIMDEVNDWAKKNDLDIVSLAETGEVIYRSDKVDATNEIMKLINAKFDETKKKEEVAQKTAAPIK